MRVKVLIKLSEKTVLPEYKSPGASGFDLHAFLEEPVEIPPGGWRLIPTGIRVELPEGFELQIRSRSGLALQGIFVLNSPGTVDSDYRGEIKVVLANLSEKPFVVKPGDRIAQAVLARVYRAEFEIVEKLSESKRSEGGFGSTGL